jgi:DNA-directed RNA polymerase sigma subunit (sigma70/sigma32)
MNNTNTPAELLISIRKKEEEIKGLRDKIKEFQSDIAQMKAQERKLRKSQEKQSEIEEIKKLGFGDEWIYIGELGVSARQVIAMKRIMDGDTLKSIGEELQVCPSRVVEIRETGLRRLMRNLYLKRAKEIYDLLQK